MFLGLNVMGYKKEIRGNFPKISPNFPYFPLYFPISAVKPQDIGLFLNAQFLHPFSALHAEYAYNYERDAEQLSHVEQH